MTSRIRGLVRVLCHVNDVSALCPCESLLFTCSNLSLCNRAIVLYFSLSPERQRVKGTVTLRDCSSKSYVPFGFWFSREASICLIVLMIRCASSVSSFFSLWSSVNSEANHRERSDVRCDQSQLVVQCF